MTVRLTDAADNWVYADAVRIEQVYLPEVELKRSDDLLGSLESGQPFRIRSTRSGLLM